MMFSKEDFTIKSPQDIIDIAPIVVFLALVAPFLIAAYTLGFLMDLVGWLKSD
jgi:hypothetical protein